MGAKFPTFIKDPQAVLDFNMDWSSWLTTADNISTFTISADSTAIVISTYAEASNTITTWLSGGTLGEKYLVKVRVVTDASRTDERSFRVIVRNR